MSNSTDKKIELGFEGKVVSFSSAADTLAMKKVRFETIKERLFVVGEIPKNSTTNDWAVGRPCAIAWDSVIDYMIFDSETQYVELIEKSSSDSD